MASKTSNITFDLTAKDNASKVFDAFTKKADAQQRAIGALRKAGTAQFVALTAATLAFGVSSVKAYAEAEQSQQQLANAFDSFPALLDTDIDAMNRFNTALMKKTGIDDDAIASSEALLAQFELTGKQIEQLTPLMVDYSLKTGKDLTTSSEDLGKAIMGQGRALKNIGVQFTDTGSRAGNFAELVDALSSKVGGFAEDQAQTAIGQTRMLATRFEELQESVGQKLLPDLLRLAEMGNDTLEWIENNEGAAQALAITVGTLSVAIAVAANWQKISTTYTTLATAAQWLYNAAVVRATTIKAADAAATAASQAAIAGLTAQTAAATTATTANAAATKAQATELRPMMKGGLIVGGVLAGFAALTAAAEALPSATRKSSLSIAETTAALLEMLKTGRDLKGALDFSDDVFGLTGDVDSLADAAKRIGDPSLIDRVQDFGGSVRGLLRGDGDTSRTRSIEQIDTIGQSLASLVQSGNAGTAAQQFSMLSDEWVRGGGSVEDLRELMPAYTDALAEVANQEQLTGEATAGANAVTQESADKALAAAEAVLSLVDAIQLQIDKQREAAGIALDENSAMRGYQQAIDEATVALTENGATLDVTTAAGRKNQAALDEIASSTWDWVEAGSKAGESQQSLSDRMANGRQSFMDAATQLGLTADQAAALADEMNLIPTNIVANVTLTGYADTYKYLTNLQTVLRSVTGDRSIHIATGRGGSGGLTFADGGPVYGPGTSTSDSILAALSNGEFVHTAAAHSFWGTQAMHAMNNRDVPALLGAVTDRRLAGGGQASAPLLIGGSGYSGLSRAGREASAAIAGPTSATFNIYDVDGVFLGAMRGAADNSARFTQQARSAALRGGGRR